jgi:hypothetical protein
MAEKKFSCFFQFSGAGRHAMSATWFLRKIGDVGGLTSSSDARAHQAIAWCYVYHNIQALSGLETHRSNEWESIVVAILLSTLRGIYRVIAKLENVKDY